jgi:hypothetical protein
MQPRPRNRRKPEAFDLLARAVRECVPLEALPISKEFIVERASVATENYHSASRSQDLCQFTMIIVIYFMAIAVFPVRPGKPGTGDISRDYYTLRSLDLSGQIVVLSGSW